ncbi:MAG TPA: succinate dehydrogenase, cytochrome b556 subunit [Dissulfurispiraceae bacterium]
MRYKIQTGAFAWLIHRGTGVALTLYVFLHLYVLSHLKDPVSYKALMELMKNPLVRLGEAGLLGLVVAHALNGIRVTLLELGAPTRIQKTVFWISFAIGAFIVIIGGVPMIGGGH